MAGLSEDGMSAVGDAVRFVGEGIPPIVGRGVELATTLFASRVAEGGLFSECEVALVSASLAEFLFYREPDLAIAVAGWAEGVGPR